MSVYDINGNEIGNYIDPSTILTEEKNLNYDTNVLSVNHRGYSTEAQKIHCLHIFFQNRWASIMLKLMCHLRVTV